MLINLIPALNFYRKVNKIWTLLILFRSRINHNNDDDGDDDEAVMIKSNANHLQLATRKHVLR